MLRPVSLVRRVGEYGLKVMESVYPEQSTEAGSAAASSQSPARVERTILHRGKSAIVVAVNVKTLMAEAEKAKGVIEFAPQVGDFVGPLCLRSINCTDFYEAREGGISGPIRSSIEPGNSA